MDRDVDDVDVDDSSELDERVMALDTNEVGPLERLGTEEDGAAGAEKLL